MYYCTFGVVLLCWVSSVVKADDWALMWSDEFDQDGGVDDSVWTPLTGFLGYNGEFQIYSNAIEHLRVQDGKLLITALKAPPGFTSGRINTMNKVKTKYAMIEASIKIPDIRMGLWPAFWTLGEDYPVVDWPACGEIDIMEIGQKLGVSMNLGNRRVVSAFHWENVNNYVLEDRFLDVSYPLNDGFHTYKLIWQPDYISTFVDDQLVGTLSLDACDTHQNCQEFSQYHFLILNLAIGGEFTCCEHGFALENDPEGTTYTMEVDYVRIYGNEHTELVLTPQNAQEIPETAQPMGLPTQPLSTAPSVRPQSPAPSTLPTSLAPSVGPIATYPPTTNAGTERPTISSTFTTASMTISPSPLAASSGTTLSIPEYENADPTPDSAPAIDGNEGGTIEATNETQVAADGTDEISNASPNPIRGMDSSSRFSYVAHQLFVNAVFLSSILF